MKKNIDYLYGWLQGTMIYMFMHYGDEMILKQVIVGLNSSVLRSEIEQSIGNKCEVEIFKVRKDYCEFKMVRDENF